ncbi:TonB-linked SusC/RagA family outer membrane protein [Filimonas zeae]|uniref:SusC/RagA family TonB-linked outer membrane protein n=1 Tax=Filimonas zeae TaxID=1737353 RepID=A0A917IX71_9BACT|nr:SusC/RagA family TonB-linked outer membrane protein [Filimonas zeae]MDR6339277.1 TonB-linked SusC/RagA family outer membrane protein [Filimonas zeae]GGH64329.1 SusC/RagA family TonB-linked outer membrane protein [Filimonas zeae]
MKSNNKHILAGLLLLSAATATQAQTLNTVLADSLAAATRVTENRVDMGIRNEKKWRTTGAVFTITGEELSRTNASNLLNTLQARIPGLSVEAGAGEPGYDNPFLFIRGQSSWNVAENALAIYLDGFQVDLNALSALSPFEIETITVLKDAAAAAVYGFRSGTGVLSIRTKEGTTNGKTKIELNARYGNLRPIAMPKVMDAYGYVTAYNQALKNDGLPIKYYNPELYKASDDPFHPNVNWYDKVLNNSSATQDYNLSFRGGNNRARFFVLGGLTDFKGAYKDADAVNKDFGTNAKFKRINLRANVNVQLNANLSVKATVSGITEDRNTPAGFTASQLFANLLRLPAAAFPVKNLNGTWGNNAVYNFNPVQLLRQNGVYSSHTRSLQTNISFEQKLDALTKGLSLHGGISYSNLYVGILEKRFAVPSYEITKDAYDNPVIDANGNVTYKVLGAVSQGITDAGNDHWNRNAVQLGFNYDRTFGKHTFTGFLQATRSGYSHDGQLYAVVEQGLRGSVTYDYSQKYVADLSFSYAGSGDFKNGSRYGLFPALGLGWIASNEAFLANNKVISFLKVRGSYGITGNTNEAYRFLFEKWGIGGGGIILGTTNTTYGGRTEGAYPNSNFTWEEKKSANIGVDITLLNKLTATIDVFTEKRKGILEAPVGVPQYTGFTFRNTNTGEATNKGAEISLQYRDKTTTGFEYYGGATLAYARNEITRRSQEAQPYDYLYEKGYRINQYRGLQNAGFYQVADFDANGNVAAGVVKSTYGQVRPGDLKYADINGDGIINDYDKTPLRFTKLPEMTLGFNIGFKYAGFDFDAFVQGIMNRTVNLLDEAFTYTHPLANNNNITAFSSNPWTPETAATATSPRLSTLANNNNEQQADFWLRNGNYFKLRSAELGYTLPAKKFLKRFDILRVYISGNNLLSTKIDGLEPERLSMGYPLMRTITAGIKAKF